MFHEIIIIGRLGRDAEMRYTPDGNAVSNFNVATDDGYGDNKKTVWFRCSLWRERAEKLTQYLTKGQVVMVKGRLQSTKEGEARTWQDQGGKTHASFEISVTEIKLLPGGQRHGENAEPEPERATSGGSQDVPF